MVKKALHPEGMPAKAPAPPVSNLRVLASRRDACFL
jgi:hypothetical protein